MSRLSETNFETLYGSSGTTFPDNTSGQISESDMRQFGQDIKDSLVFQETGSNTDIRYFEQNDWMETGAPPSEWDFTSSGAGAATGNSTHGVDNTEHAMGVHNISTGTTTTGMAMISRPYFEVGYGATFKIRMRMAVVNLSDGTETYTFTCGIGGTFGTPNPSNGLYFRYTHSVNSGKFQQVSRVGGVETAADTGVTADTTYRIFEIQINSNISSVSFYIDGTQTGSAHTTNLPVAGTSLSMFFRMEKSAGTTTRSAVIDWHDILITRTTAR